MDISFILSELQKAGLTQTQIGLAIGLKQPTISDMASGKAGVKRPSHQVISGLEKLAREHGVLLDRRADPP
jgi:transcriptional regulator with XRE-family HTH domain